MKAVILAGGLGTRISEETNIKPKPMVEIGGKPILWHILKIFSAFNIYEFIICLGYKGYIIKEYFSNYFLHMSDVTIDVCKNRMEIHNNHCEPWKITLVDTGPKTMTGGRLKRIKPYIEKEEAFCFTYGDGVGNVNIKKLIEYHFNNKNIATMTVVNPPGRYGAVSFDGDKVYSFVEKPKGEGNWINGGFFVLSPKVIDYIEGDDTTWEKEPLERLSEEGKLYAFRHDGFWQAMDTLRDKNSLETLWSTGKAPWMIWN